jgi:hypothetical protein
MQSAIIASSGHANATQLCSSNAKKMLVFVSIVRQTYRWSFLSREIKEQSLFAKFKDESDTL